MNPYSSQNPLYLWLASSALERVLESRESSALVTAVCSHLRKPKEVLEKLKESGLGCHVGRTFAGAFAYADDIALVSPSLSGLRQMIQICEQYAMEYSIVLTLSNQS